jgi:tRNA(adenine34) deaminase
MTSRSVSRCFLLYNVGGGYMNYMNEAYKEAMKALKIDEVPVGAIIVKDKRIIARGFNKKEANNNVLGHAELVALSKACKKLNSWRLNDCEIYVTLEPCSMCLSALIHARIAKIYYGCKDPKSGAIEGAFDLQKVGNFNHKIESECLEDTRCSLILKEYFKDKRRKKNID